MSKDDDRSFIEKLISQWPGAAGLGLIGLGIYILATVGSASRGSGGRAGVYCIAGGIAFLGYWALANRDDGYNF